MKKLIFTIIFICISSLLLAENDTISLKEYKKISKFFNTGNYQQVLTYIKEIENKGGDNSYTYKFKGTYKNNSLFWYYKTSSQIHLKSNPDDIVSNLYHLKSIDQNNEYLNLPVYNNFKTELIRLSELYYNKNITISKRYCDHIKNIWNEETELYLKLYPADTLQYISVTNNDYLKIKNFDYSSVDTYVRKVPYKTSIEEQTAVIVEKFKTDQEKVRAIYIWITHYITFDKTEKINDYQNTFKYKRGVCQGISQLFHVMCCYAGIKSTYIIGTASNQNGFGVHIWNIVSINDNFYFIDATWGMVNREKYFLSSDEDLFPSHYIFEGQNLKKDVILTPNLSKYKIYDQEIEELIKIYRNNKEFTNKKRS